MSLKPIVLFTLLVVSIFSVKAQQYQINATLTGFVDGTKFYLKDLNADKDIDSALVTNGKLSLIGKSTAAKSYWLYSKSKTKLYYTNLLIGPEHIQITGDASDFPRNLKITGSVNQDVANLLNDQTKSLWATRDSIVNIIMPFLMGDQNDSTKAITKKLGSQMNKIDSVMDGITIKFISQNLNSFAALQELYFKRSKYKKEDFEKLFASVKPEFKQSSYGNKIKNYMKVGDPLKKGDPFFDFTASDINGKKYQLSSYKGKYILIDFTQTYCAPCVESAASLKTLNSKYADRLQIISFYAEANQKVMKVGLDRDKFTWPSVWDGKGSDSEITLKYGASGFPTFVLIDPAGKIVLKLSGYGKDGNNKSNLENALDQILEKTK